MIGMSEVTYQPIGIIHSPFKEQKGTPIQSEAGREIAGTVEVFPEYIEGLQDLDGFSHIYLLFHFHLAKPASLTAKPYLDVKTRGVFAIRGPSRPNRIGLSIVRLVGIEENILHIKDMDILDGTPLLDIKPYIPEFDVKEAERIGWYADKAFELSQTDADERFERK